MFGANFFHTAVRGFEHIIPPPPAVTPWVPQATWDLRSIQEWVESFALLRKRRRVTVYEVEEEYE